MQVPMECGRRTALAREGVPGVFTRGALGLALTALTLAPLGAQDFRATITGHVTDQSGAAVPEA